MTPDRWTPCDKGVSTPLTVQLSPEVLPERPSRYYSDSHATATVYGNGTVNGPVNGYSLEPTVNGTTVTECPNPDPDPLAVYKEREFTELFGLDFSHRGRSEPILLEDGRYLGIFEFKYDRFNATFNAMVWMVSYHQIGPKIFTESKRGLLLLKQGLYDLLRLGPPTSIFRGRHAVQFDYKGRIATIIEMGSL